ncbi:hypothetical protein ACFL02_08490 [Planctomycetota bacterium]
MRKKVKIGVFSGLGGVILVFMVYFAWYVGVDPTISTSYVKELNKLGRPVEVPESENAWPSYLQAMSLYHEPNQIISNIVTYINWENKTYHQFSELDETDQTVILQWIRQYQDDFEQLSSEAQAAIRVVFSGDYLIPDSMNNADAYEVYEFSWKGLANKYFLGTLGRNDRFDFLYLLGQRISENIIGDTFPEFWHRGVAAELLHKWIEQGKSEEHFILWWIKQNQPAWQVFESGSRKPYCWFDYNDQETSLLEGNFAPDLEWFTTATQMGVWRARMAEKQGRLREAFDDCITVLRANVQLQNHTGLLAEQVWGMALNNMVYCQILKLSNSEMITAQVLKRARQQLETVYQNGYPYINFEPEKLRLLDTVQHIFTASGSGGGHINADEFNRWIGRDISDLGLWRSLDQWFEGAGRQDQIMTLTGSFRHARRDETVAQAEKLYDRLPELARMSPWERSTRQVSIVDIVNTLDKEKYYLIHKTFDWEYYENVLHRSFQHQALHEAVVTILALRRWRLEKGQYPQNLEELSSPDRLRQLPDDPYGPDILQYIPQENGFILYSWGVDFNDDEGTTDLRYPAQRLQFMGDLVFWPALDK